MSVDLFVQSGTKFALEQWLDARGLGSNVQDTDPESPIFGQYFYTHTAPGTFYYWNHPDGKIPAVGGGSLAGFYARLSFPSSGDMPSTLTEWVTNSTAVAVLETFNGVGGEGIVIVNPEGIYDYCEANDLPAWGGLLGVANQWSDPRLWAFENVMAGDMRDFDGTTYESTIDFNVWSPTQYPQGWTEIGPAEPEEPEIPEWATGVAYTVGDKVTYSGITYTCRQSHTAIVGWQPPNVLALWLPE